MDKIWVIVWNDRVLDDRGFFDTEEGSMGSHQATQADPSRGKTRISALVTTSGTHKPD